MSSRPQGDGKDFAYRQTIDKRYAVAARQRARLLATCRMHLLCGVLAFAWAVFVPRSLGVHTVPLPCTAAVTAVFCGVFGASAATGNPAALAGFAKIARSCIFLVRRNKFKYLLRSFTFFTFSCRGFSRFCFHVIPPCPETLRRLHSRDML